MLGQSRTGLDFAPNRKLAARLRFAGLRHQATAHRTQPGSRVVHEA